MGAGTGRCEGLAPASITTNGAKAHLRICAIILIPFSLPDSFTRRGVQWQGQRGSSAVFDMTFGPFGQVPSSDPGQMECGQQIDSPGP
jgi:hypothetical protein